jgi:hypothetical protein
MKKIEEVKLLLTPLGFFDLKIRPLLEEYIEQVKQQERNKAFEEFVLWEASTGDLSKLKKKYLFETTDTNGIFCALYKRRITVDEVNPIILLASCSKSLLPEREVDLVKYVFCGYVKISNSYLIEKIGRGNLELYLPFAESIDDGVKNLLPIDQSKEDN